MHRYVPGRSGPGSWGCCCICPPGSWRISCSWRCAANCWAISVAWMPWNRPSSQPTSCALAIRSSDSLGISPSSNGSASVAARPAGRATAPRTVRPPNVRRSRRAARVTPRRTVRARTSSRSCLTIEPIRITLAGDVTDSSSGAVGLGRAPSALAGDPFGDLVGLQGLVRVGHGFLSTAVSGESLRPACRRAERSPRPTSTSRGDRPARTGPSRRDRGSSPARAPRARRRRDEPGSAGAIAGPNHCSSSVCSFVTTQARSPTSSRAAVSDVGDCALRGVQPTEPALAGLQRHRRQQLGRRHARSGRRRRPGRDRRSRAAPSPPAAPANTSPTSRSAARSSAS